MKIIKLCEIKQPPDSVKTMDRLFSSLLTDTSIMYDIDGTYSDSTTVNFYTLEADYNENANTLASIVKYLNFDVNFIDPLAYEEYVGCSTPNATNLLDNEFSAYLDVIASKIYDISNDAFPGEYSIYYNKTAPKDNKVSLILSMLQYLHDGYNAKLLDQQNTIIEFMKDICKLKKEIRGIKKSEDKKCTLDEDVKSFIEKLGISHKHVKVFNISNNIIDDKK